MDLHEDTIDELIGDGTIIICRGQRTLSATGSRLCR